MKRRVDTSGAGSHLPGRRAFLKVGALSYMGLSLSDYFQLSSLMAGTNPKAKAQSCIMIWMFGGQSHLDTWDVKGNSGFNPISTNVPGIQISEILPKVAKHMDKLSIVRSMKSESNAHSEGSYYTMTGHLPTTTTRFPSVGSIVAKELGQRNEMPAYVTTSRGRLNCRSAGFISPMYEPLTLTSSDRISDGKDFKVADLSLPGEISVEALQARHSFLNLVDERYRQMEAAANFGMVDAFDERALSLITSPTVRKAFDVSLESTKTKETYGTDRFGQGVLLARRLVEAGCRFVTVDGWNPADGHNWDTHYKNDHYLRNVLVPPLDRSLSALMEDLDQRGLLESTVVLVMGEFGRTPNINPGRGRDHWAHCWSLALGGGGIKGGQVVGASDERGAYVAERMVTIGDLFATVYKALGIDYAKTYLGPGRRPIYIANAIGDKQGQPLHELI